MVKYIVFDFDGTLADSKEVLLATLDEIAEKHKLAKIDKKDLDKLNKLPMVERCRKIGLPLYKLPLLAPEFYRIYKKDLHMIKLYDGMREVIASLKETGYEIAIISSNSENNIREFLENRKVEGIKDVFCSNNLLGKDKVINKFLKKYRLDPSEIIYVGDEHRDIVAGRKCGVRVMWVDWGYDDITLAREENPDFIAYKPGDILEVLSAPDIQQ